MKSHQNIYAELLGVDSTPSLHESERIECIEGRISLDRIYETRPEFVMATIGLPRSIHLWMPDHWQFISNFLLHPEPTAIGMDAEALASLRRVLLGSAASVEVGQDGAIELPEHLREFAGIADAAYWRRHGRVIELAASPDASN